MSKKVYLLTDDDLALLLVMVDRDPRHGQQGGSSAVLSEVEERAHDVAHRFYNYQVRRWLDGIRG